MSALRWRKPPAVCDRRVMAVERLQKIIASAGIASRRKAEELISCGQVSVNGLTVTELGTKADPDRDQIRVGGRPLRQPEHKLYLLLNKPKGYVSTVSDPQHRPTVVDLVRGVAGRLYPVGRLDYNSEGLLLMTNDGDFAQQMTHAPFDVPKTYLVKISGRPDDEKLARLRAGISIGGEYRPGRRPMPAVKTAPAKITLIKDAPNPWYEVTLIEGRNRQLHRMFERIGHHVEKIKRVRYGPLELDVPPGQFRILTAAEVNKLRATAHSGRRSEPRPDDAVGKARAVRARRASKR